MISAEGNKLVSGMVYKCLRANFNLSFQLYICVHFCWLIWSQICHRMFFFLFNEYRFYDKNAFE